MIDRNDAGDHVDAAEPDGSAVTMPRRGTDVARQRQFLLSLGAILLFALFIRIAVRAASGAEYFWTSAYDFYFALAKSMAAGHGYSIDGHPTAFRVPFYPVFLAVFTGGQHNFWPLLIAQALVSTGTVVCAAALACRFFGRRAALAAAALTAVYPYYVWHDTALQESGLLTFLTALGTVLLFATQRSRSLMSAASAGLVFGMAILTRSSVLPFAIFGVGWLAMSDRMSGPAARRLGTAAVCLAAIGATLSPWLVRNHALTGRWTLGTEFGEVLYYGNNPHTFDYYPSQSIDLTVAAAEGSFTETDRKELRALGNDTAAIGDWYARRALSYIRSDPKRFLVAALRKNLAAFGILPSPRHDWKANLIQGGSYAVILIFAAIVVWRTRRRWREFLPIYANFILFAGITGVIWGHSSHRAFLDVYLMIFAAGLFAARRPLGPPLGPRAFRSADAIS